MSSTAVLNAASLQVSVATTESQLSELAPHWDALAGDAIPFRSFAWSETWWRHYGEPGSRLFTLVVRDEQRDVVGIAPWYLTRSSRQGRVVRFLGSGEICSDYLTILCEGEQAEAVAERLADWLAREGAGQWSLLDFKGAETLDPTMLRLGERLAEHGHVVDRHADMNCWRVELPETWDEFLAMLSKARRARTRTLLKRTVDAGRVVLHEVKTPAELEQAFEILVDLHQKRRRSLSQAGCFVSRRFTEFHRETAERLLEQGQLRLLWSEFEGRPLAAEYGFVGGETIYYYLGGFEPELAEENPGWLAMAVSLKLAIEQGYRVYDFLRGDESYKASWRGVPQPLVHVRIVGKQTSARLRYATWRACRGLKHWARQFLQRTKG